MTHLDELIELVRHPAIQGRRGRWGIGDAVWDLFSKRYGWVTEITANSVWINFHIVSQYTEHNNPDLVWIPKLNDPIHPKRGLMGFCNGLIQIEKHHDTYYVKTLIDSLSRTYHGPTPEIAVCKAIIAQQESL